MLAAFAAERRWDSGMEGMVEGVLSEDLARNFGVFFVQIEVFSLSQWLNFKLFGIPYLVGKMSSRSNDFFQGPGRLSEHLELEKTISLVYKVGHYQLGP